MSRAIKTRAGGAWTEARFWSFIRSSLRRASVKWPPRSAAKKAASRPYVGPDKRRKFDYRCAKCGGWFAGKDVEVDHIEPCGELRMLADLPTFVERLFCETDGLQVLCKKKCHREK